MNKIVVCVSCSVAVAAMIAAAWLIFWNQNEAAAAEALSSEEPSAVISTTTSPQVSTTTIRTASLVETAVVDNEPKNLPVSNSTTVIKPVTTVSASPSTAKQSPKPTSKPSTTKTANGVDCSVTGKIINDKTNEPIPGFVVGMVGESGRMFHTKTDGTGSFNIRVTEKEFYGLAGMYLTYRPSLSCGDKPVSLSVGNIYHQIDRAEASAFCQAQKPGPCNLDPNSN